jgi:Tfp pilus assembly protein PilO
MMRLRNALGRTGLAALALILASAAFSRLVVEPLESRAAALKNMARPAAQARHGGSAGKVEAVYKFLAREEEPTDALAKLHGIGVGTGVRLQSATYRTHREGRVERLEIVLPLAGSYAQIRDFAARALAEIPATSLDQLSLKRDSRASAELNAELRLSIHRVKS